MTASSARIYSAIAGHPVLDLVNTVAWRLSAERWDDRVTSYDDLVTWSLQFGFLDESEARALRRLAHDHPLVAAREFARVRGLRESVYAAAFPDSAHPEGPDSAAPSLLAAEYAEAIGAGALEAAVPWSWHFDVDLALPRRRLALAAVDLLSGVDPDALGQCADDECGWVFIDTSPRHNRLWCVAADCGNRNRVRRHTARARTAG